MAHQPSSPSEGGEDSYRNEGTPDTRPTIFSPAEHSTKSFRALNDLASFDGEGQPVKFPTGAHHGYSSSVDKDPFVTSTSTTKSHQSKKLSATAVAFRPANIPLVANGTSELTPKPIGARLAQSSTKDTSCISSELGLTRSLVVSSPSEKISILEVEEYITKLQQGVDPYQGSITFTQYEDKVYVRFSDIRVACRVQANAHVGGDDWLIQYAGPGEFNQNAYAIATPPAESYEGVFTLLCYAPSSMSDHEVESVVHAQVRGDGGLFAFVPQPTHGLGPFGFVVEFCDLAMSTIVYMKYLGGLLNNFGIEFFSLPYVPPQGPGVSSNPIMNPQSRATYQFGIDVFSFPYKPRQSAGGVPSNPIMDPQSRATFQALTDDFGHLDLAGESGNPRWASDQEGFSLGPHSMARPTYASSYQPPGGDSVARRQGDVASWGFGSQLPSVAHDPYPGGMSPAPSVAPSIRTDSTMNLFSHTRVSSGAHGSMKNLLSPSMGTSTRNMPYSDHKSGARSFNQGNHFQEDGVRQKPFRRLGPHVGPKVPSYSAAGHHNTVDINRIQSGTDVRTTIMLRNIPNKVDQKLLKHIVDESSGGKYDFMYLRIDFTNDCNVGYAFINFVDPLDIIDFVRARGNKRWNCFKSDKVAEVSYATIQGKDCLVSKFRNSSVMLEAIHCRPKLYYTLNGPAPTLAGQEEPFPEPDNPSKMKRSCDNAEHVGLFTPNAGQHYRDEQRRRRSQFDRGTRLAAMEESDYM